MSLGAWLAHEDPLVLAPVTLIERRVLAYVETEPGATLADVREDLALDAGEAMAALDALTEAGRLVRQGTRDAWCWRLDCGRWFDTPRPIIGGCKCCPF